QADPVAVPAWTFSTAHGSNTIATDGRYTYTPTVGYDGADSYSFTATAEEDSTAAPVNFTGTEGNDLTVTPPSNTVAENSSVTGNVLTGATDAEGDPITVTAGTFSTAHGSITIATDGSYTYTPTVGYDGADSYSFTATAGEDSTAATVNFTVTEVNDLTVTPPSNTVAENS